MNKVILMGRLTRDPEIRYTNGEDQMAIARYTIAVDRRGKDSEADFPSIVAFGKAAVFAEKYLKKGTKVVVTGRLQTGSYTNNAGVKVYTTDVIVEEQEFAESKKEVTEGTEKVQYDTDFVNIPEGIDEELPFAQPSRK